MGFFKRNDPAPEVRRPQVEKIKAATKDYADAYATGCTREDRARAAAVLNALQRTSTPAEFDQGTLEHPLS